MFPLVGFYANVWWFDPVGAGLLSLFIIYDWAQTGFENVTRLSGAAVGESLEKKLIYLAWRFSPVVNGFKNLTAYHAGDGVWTEIDVLFDEKTSLGQAHDIAETLQYCCEGNDRVRLIPYLTLLTVYVGLTEVDRAFVSIDCRFLLLIATVTEANRSADATEGPGGHST